VDTASGAVAVLVTGISRADQIALHPSGDLFVTSEVHPAATTGRLFRVSVAYDGAGLPLPLASSATSVATSLSVDNPEGLVVLARASAYGAAGDLLVAEDLAAGRLLHVAPGTGAAAVLAAGLARPEGLAFGDFAGASAPALYAAETLNGRVVRVDPAGTWSTVGDPSLVALTAPDNVAFGPDGFLYVSEDRPAPGSRIVRIAPDGAHEVFASGFGEAQGMAFDANGDLYIAEQERDRIWRVRFSHGGSFCNGADGALAVCPCSNPGHPDSGCDNAQGTGGVRLDVAAQRSASATLAGTGFPAGGAPAALVVRSAALAPTGPVPFGDGVRCIAAPVVRLGATLASGGISTHVVGHGAGPGLFYYQVWYRSMPAAFCDPAAAFNLSSGRELTWP
jgi:sugar lactone lactonase YvrE